MKENIFLRHHDISRKNERRLKTNVWNYQKKFYLKEFKIILLY